MRAGESCLASGLAASPRPLRADLRGLVPGVLEAKPAWRKDDAAAEGGMENDMNAML